MMKFSAMYFVFDASLLQLFFNFYFYNFIFVQENSGNFMTYRAHAQNKTKQLYNAQCGKIKLRSQQ